MTSRNTTVIHRRRFKNGSASDLINTNILEGNKRTTGALVKECRTLRRQANGKTLLRVRSRRTLPRRLDPNPWWHILTNCRAIPPTHRKQSLFCRIARQPMMSQERTVTIAWMRKSKQETGIQPRAFRPLNRLDHERPTLFDTCQPKVRRSP